LTLALLTTILAMTTIYEAVLLYTRRLIVMVVGARLDAKLNLPSSTVCCGYTRLFRAPPSGRGDHA
jgi:hypothetical protein